VLNVMRKPSVGEFEKFSDAFTAASRRAGKEQYLVPYFIAAHPGAGLEEAIEMAAFLRKSGYKPRQVQDFIPAPMDWATAIFWTGLDPRTLKPVPVATTLRDRSVQRALLQWFKPENWFAVHDALRKAGREDLIGHHPEALIPPRPPASAVAAEKKRSVEGRRGKKKKDPRSYRPKR
jgi:radical SAM superfamily enzyme YgiQ (UPF0313 family)